MAKLADVILWHIQEMLLTAPPSAPGDPDWGYQAIEDKIEEYIELYELGHIIDYETGEVTGNVYGDYQSPREFAEEQVAKLFDQYPGDVDEIVNGFTYHYEGTTDFERAVIQFQTILNGQPLDMLEVGDLLERFSPFWNE